MSHDVKYIHVLGIKAITFHKSHGFYTSKHFKENCKNIKYLIYQDFLLVLQLWFLIISFCLLYVLKLYFSGMTGLRHYLFFIYIIYILINFVVYR